MIFCRKLRQISSIANRKLYSSLCDFTVTDVKIPTSYGHIQGKLWEPTGYNEKSLPEMPIVCIHGWLDNAGSFDNLLPRVLKPHMKVFAMDLPGHGFSSHFISPYYDFVVVGTIAVQTIRRHFNWDKISLLSHSMGAVVSTVYTGAFPENVLSYVGLDNFHPEARNFFKVLRLHESGIANMEQKLAKKLDSPTYKYAEILKKVIQSRKNTVTEEGCKILLKRGAIPVTPNSEFYKFTHDIKVTVFGPGAVTVEQTHEMAKAVQCPACIIIRKEPNDVYTRRQDLLDIIELMQKNDQNVEFHKIPGTHHFHLNDPTIASEIINAFYEKNKL